ncbi:hypothetical protein B2J88_39205 [Rhodococcus sp. SRB_17]|nr:hypothetical protein [Rhodococcus sp. SRB_17]
MPIRAFASTTPRSSTCWRVPTAKALRQLGAEAHMCPQLGHARLLRRFVDLRYQRPAHAALGAILWSPE